MEYIKHLTLVVLLCIIVEFQTGFAIQCHVCNSRDDGKDCEEITNKAYLKNCSDEKGGTEYKGCWKIDQWVDFKVLEKEEAHRVIRRCAKEGNLDKPCYYRGGFGGRVNHCYCEGDGCNSASSMGLGVAAAFMVITAILRQFLNTGL